jgi:antitoxin ParD1/3/4
MPTKNTSFALSEHFAAFAEQQVTKGRYGSTSEVIRAGLRLLEDRESKLTALQDAIDEGLASGVSGPFDFDEFLADRHAEYAAKK